MWRRARFTTSQWGSFLLECPSSSLEITPPRYRSADQWGKQSLKDGTVFQYNVRSRNTAYVRTKCMSRSSLELNLEFDHITLVISSCDDIRVYMKLMQRTNSQGYATGLHFHMNVLCGEKGRFWVVCMYVVVLGWQRSLAALMVEKEY